MLVEHDGGSDWCQLVLMEIYGPPDIDPTTYPAPEIALVAEGSTLSTGDWHTGAWVDGEAALMVGPGPGGTVFADGDYLARVRITTGTEKPILPSGRVRIARG